MRYAFAGDRQISCNILKFIISKGYRPLALMVSDGISASHADELKEIAGLDDSLLIRGKEIKSEPSAELLRSLDLDYIIGIHFPYIIPGDVIRIPKVGFLNLHPAYLPFNKGWHTPSWAILEKTPYGATLHFMDEALDEGDIIHQLRQEIDPTDTSDSLYQKVLALEEKVFEEAFDALVSLDPPRKKQPATGTAHLKKDLEAVKEIHHDVAVMPLELIDRLRALTTNKPSESAFIRIDGKKIGIRIELTEIDE